MDFETKIALLFYAFLGILIFIFRNRFERMYKVVFVYKTKKGLNLMKKLSKYQLFWKVYSTLAIPVGIFFAIWLGWVLFKNALDILNGTSAAGVSIVVPGIKMPGSPLYIPLFQGLIAIFILAVVHEFSHGIIASMYKLKLKSTGFGFFLVMPLAFVEIDEKKMAKLPRLAQMRIAAAGPFANIVLWFLLMLVLAFVFSPFVNNLVEYKGINITSIYQNSPAEKAGLKPGMVIYGINGNETKDLSSFGQVLLSYKPNDTIILVTNEGNFSVTLGEKEGKPYLGVLLQQYSTISKEGRERYGVFADVLIWLFRLVSLTATLNLLVGVMNFIPIAGLDGGLIFYNLLSYFIKDKKLLSKALTSLFSIYIALLLFNLVGPFLVGLLR